MASYIKSSIQNSNKQNSTQAAYYVYGHPNKKMFFFFIARFSVRFAGAVSLCQFIYVPEHADKENPHLEYTDACIVNNSTVLKETTKERSAHRVMATLFHTILLLGSNTQRFVVSS